MGLWPFGKKAEPAPAAAPAAAASDDAKPKKKICCACPDTKVGHDLCAISLHCGAHALLVVGVQLCGWKHVCIACTLSNRNPACPCAEAKGRVHRWKRCGMCQDALLHAGPALHIACVTRCRAQDGDVLQVGTVVACMQCDAVVHACTPDVWHDIICHPPGV